MKRSLTATVALSLAALALGAAAPAAIAAPGAGSSTTPPPSVVAPTEPPTSDPDHPVMRATASGPTSKTGTASIHVTGVYAGDRIEGLANPAVGRGEATGRVLVTGGPKETATVVLPAPRGGWKAQTRYNWFVMDLDHGLAVEGHFTTPAWPGEEVRAEFDAQVQLPTNPKGAIVFTISNAKPGTKVEVVLGRNGQPYINGPRASGIADAKGGAVLRMMPEGAGWAPHTQYIWLATSEKLTSDGSFTIPDWRVAIPGPVKPAPPKDSGGGLAKTGF